MQTGQASPVNSSEVQVVPEELAKILEEIAHAGRRVSAKVAQSLHQEKQQHVPDTRKEDLRIQMGRRVVYGQTVRGFRHEITPELLQTLAQAIQQPVSEEISPDAYKNRVPRIEIKLGEQVLFRQERDGVVTVNELQQEQHAQKQATQTDRDGLLDGDRNILTEREELAFDLNSFHSVTDQNGLDSSLTEVELDANPLEFEPSDNGISNEKKITNERQVNFNNNFDRFYQEIKQLFDENYDVESEASNQNEASHDFSTVEIPEIPPAIRVATHEIDKAPESNAKQLFKALVNDLGKEAQKLSQQAMKWVSTRPEWIREQNVASTVLKLFKDNYTKTGVTTYQAENYSIKLQGLKNYQIHDRNGELLMKFQQTAIGGIKVTENRMTTSDFQQFAHAGRSLKHFDRDILSQDSFQRVASLRGLAPHGDVEIVNTMKTAELMSTARKFLKSMGVERWDAGKQGNYNIECKGNGSLKIESKADGRGTIFLLTNGQVLSNKLDSKDFTHFRHLEQVMQKDLQAKQEKSISKTSLQQNHKHSLPKKKLGLELG
jgi:hypothetical protein